MIVNFRKTHLIFYPNKCVGGGAQQEHLLVHFPLNPQSSILTPHAASSTPLGSDLKFGSRCDVEMRMKTTLHSAIKLINKL